MDWRTRDLTRELQSHDHDLFCKRDPETGCRHVMRKHNVYRHLVMNDDAVLFYPVSCPQHVLSLTHNWSMNGEPVDWGLVPLMNKIRAIDTHYGSSEIDALPEMYEQAAVAKKRDFSNKTEAFLKEFRPQFAKTFGDVNTANMDKKIDPRRKKDGPRK